MDLWINGRYNARVNGFTFLDGTPVSDSLDLWESKEPNQEGCIRIVNNRSWRDWPCQDPHGFICERNITDGNI